MNRVEQIRLALMGGMSAAVAVMLLSCAASGPRERPPAEADGKYDVEFPGQPLGSEIEQIGDAVKMLSCIAYYKVYPFDEKEKVGLEMVNPSRLSERAGRSSYINTSLAASATVLLYEKRHVLVLTCAHVLTFPDTIVSYHLGPDAKPGPYIRHFSLKEKQTNFVAVFPEGGELEILAVDRQADIALLGKEFGAEYPGRITSFSYPFGSARELGWGTFVYTFGFPSGFKMLTHGLVSSPNKDKTGSFLIDAAFSRGFSGGPILAIRDGSPNFELVGLVRMVSGHVTYVLTPQSNSGTIDYESGTPYAGEIFVERKTEIEYGVTQAAPVEQIREIIEENSNLLTGKGYDLRALQARWKGE